MKAIYSLPDESVAIVYSITLAEISKVVPQDAINFRILQADSIPTSREFREAWCDKLPGDQIDICHEKAKKYKLNLMEKHAEKCKEKLDHQILRSFGNVDIIASLKKKYEEIDRVVNNLEVLDVSQPAYNDERILKQISDLSELSLIDNIVG